MQHRMNGWPAALVALVVLSFTIYRPDETENAGAEATEQGDVTARSCAEAEAWVRGWLRPGQAVLIGECRAVAP